MDKGEWGVFGGSPTFTVLSAGSIAFGGEGYGFPRLGSLVPRPRLHIG